MDPPTPPPAAGALARCQQQLLLHYMRLLQQHCGKILLTWLAIFAVCIAFGPAFLSKTRRFGVWGLGWCIVPAHMRLQRP